MTTEWKMQRHPDDRIDREDWSDVPRIDIECPECGERKDIDGNCICTTQGEFDG